jgi:hypothetical protein
MNANKYQPPIGGWYLEEWAGGGLVGLPWMVRSVGLSVGGGVLGVFGGVGDLWVC